MEDGTQGEMVGDSTIAIRVSVHVDPPSRNCLYSSIGVGG